MDAHSVLLVLKAGFSGLALLFAWLAFKLIAKEQERQGAPRVGVQRLVKIYVVFALLLAVLSVIAIPLEGYVDSTRRERVLAGNQARDCRDGLSRLSNAEVAMIEDKDELKQRIGVAYGGCKLTLSELAGDGARAK